MLDFNIQDRSIIFLEKDFFEGKDMSTLGSLCTRSYRRGNYYMTYVYSKIGIQKTGIDAFYLYLVLSLFKLGYINIANKILKKNLQLIEGLFYKNSVDVKDLIEFCILFEYDEIPLDLRGEFDSLSDNDVLKLIYNARKNKDKESILKLSSYFEELQDSFYKTYIATVLGSIFSPIYFNYAANKEFFTPNMIDKNLNFNINSLSLRAIDSEIVDLFGYHNFEGRNFRFYSYPYDDGLANMHLLEYKGKYLILDCGAYNNDYDIGKIDALGFLRALNVDIRNVEGVFITHAHLDHYGSIDVLKGLGLKFFMTRQTYDLILKVGFSLDGFDINIVKYDEVVKLNTFNIIPFRNGHILGSCGYDILFGNKRVVYTGDFCLNNQFTVEGLELKKLIQRGKIDLLAIEGTYLNKKDGLEYRDNQIILSKVVKKLNNHQIKTLIPSFAIGRAQEVALILQSYNSLRTPALIDGEAADITYYFQRQIDKNIINRLTSVSNNDMEFKLFNYDVFIVSSGMLQRDSTSYRYYYELKDKDLAIVKVGFISQNNSIMNEINIFENSQFFFDIPLSGHASYNQLVETIITLSPENVIFVHTV
ncbi:MBL fold metallo-hydrolase [Caloramator sp. ALD01]|uniref:MBL fold metallo-hydrolase n=1 Tax=Caloramator sp. ALD01 TaxID=1031288 RepID=UPI0004884738|nr:MBL fold metallo-hydrolase [Caloramator sp. ALD01]